MTVSGSGARRRSHPARSFPAPARARGAFTLIELLVAIALASILVGTVALIFHGSTDIFKTSESRISIYGNARAAMDVLARDVSSMLPRDGGQQRLIIHNRCQAEGLDSVAGNIANHQGGNRADPALDAIQFRAIVPVNSTRKQGQAVNTGQLQSPTLMTVHVMYSLRPDDDPEILGTSTSNQTVSGRNLYVLRKRVYDPTTIPAAPDNGTLQPWPGVGASAALTANPWPASVVAIDAPPQPPSTQAGLPAPYSAAAYIDEAGDLCHFVLSFNVEWIHNQQPAGGAGIWQMGSLGSFASPVGLLVPPPPATSVLPQAIRVSLRVAEGSGVRQERLITRVIWVPLS